MSANFEQLTKQAFTGKYHAHGSIKEADCVIGFSFGFRLKNGKIIPGLSNDDLANFIEKHFPDKPYILQFEIADALSKKKKDLFVIRKHRVKGEYLDTSEVALQAIEIMNKHEWHKAAIIAHPFHMPRVDALCQKLGINTIVPDGLSCVRFDPKSEQEWTRDKKTWANREKYVIDFFREKGLI
jgi:hypothetical protein